MGEAGEVSYRQSYCNMDKPEQAVFKFELHEKTFQATSTVT